MHSSIAQLFSLGLLVAAPFASAYVDVAGTADLTNKRFVGGHIARAATPLEARHHTAAQQYVILKTPNTDDKLTNDIEPLKQQRQQRVARRPPNAV